ncbi:MAG: acyltransferase family protein [Lachnospiraceae bacterium]|nr:acyltransferase family protein [Lachnospiraceae bacterium]
MSSKAEEKRMIHYDLLRILAAFSVVMLHSAAQFWYTLDIYGGEWLVANSYDAVFRFGVPIFVMISGALFLSPEYQLDIKRLYQHNVLRLLIMYIIWSCVYGMWDCMVFGLWEQGWKAIIRELIQGRYHLWFLPMLIGIYMLLPMLKSWISHAEEKNIRYFLGLFVAFQIGSETVRALTVMDELHYVLDVVEVELACSYVGYFVLGYYLAHYQIGKKLRKVLYICVVPAVLCNILLGNYLARRAGEATGAIYDSYGVFTFIIAVTLFIFFREFVGKKGLEGRWNRLIRELSADTLGVYILHIGLIEGLKLIGIHSMLLPNIVGIPLYAMCCFLICMVFAAVLRRLPVIGRYLC